MVVRVVVHLYPLMIFIKLKYNDNLNIPKYNNDSKVYCCNSIYAKDNNSGAGRITFER